MVTNRKTLPSQIGKSYLLLILALISCDRHALEPSVLPVNLNTYYLFVGYEPDALVSELSIFNKEGSILGYHRKGYSKNNPFSNCLSVKFFSGDNRYVRHNLNGNYKFCTIEEVSNVVENYMFKYANILTQNLPLFPMNEENYHENVLLITKFVNSVLISPINNYYHFEGPSASAEEYLVLEEKKREINHNVINLYLPNRWFDKFSSESVRQSPNAYCRKASLSCSDVLREFNIPTNQIHFTNDKGGFHQFYEYWNPYLKKFIIVDPFYGITYNSEEGELIGFKELSKLMSTSKVSESNLKRVSIEHFYFSLEELQKGWNANLKIESFEDSRMTYSH